MAIFPGFDMSPRMLHSDKTRTFIGVKLRALYPVPRTLANFL